MKLVNDVRDQLGVKGTCRAIALARARYYRLRSPQYGPRRRRAPARKLAPTERQNVLDALHEPRFADLAPLQVWAQLLDEGTYLCSPRTMHRVLAENTEARERRDQLRHPNFKRPKLGAGRRGALRDET